MPDVEKSENDEVSWERVVAAHDADCALGADCRDSPITWPARYWIKAKRVLPAGEEDADA